MALKDHYHIENVVEESDHPNKADSWAVEYISIGRARTIMEAFDDDASGFVTVKEVNGFTQSKSRPTGWRCVLFC
jgi:hypothetical protein